MFFPTKTMSKLQVFQMALIKHYLYCKYSRCDRFSITYIPCNPDVIHYRNRKWYDTPFKDEMAPVNALKPDGFCALRMAQFAKTFSIYYFTMICVFFSLLLVEFYFI